MKRRIKRFLQVSEGIDPIQERKSQKAKMTIEQAIEVFLEKRRVWGFRKKRPSLAIFEMICCLFCLRQIPRPSGAQKLLLVLRQKLKKPPIAAKQLLTYVKQLFQFLEDREIVDINPIASLKASSIHVAGPQKGLADEKNVIGCCAMKKL